MADSWDKISLFKFQQIQAINDRKDLDDFDKVLFSTCIVFNLTEHQLDNTPPKKAGKLMAKTAKIFETPFNTRAYKRIGKYFLNYDPGSMTFGQYVELSFFLNNSAANTHYILASISNKLFQKNKPADHRKKADYFLKQSIVKITGSIVVFKQRFEAFNAEYKNLFGLSSDIHGSAAHTDKFNKRYGWVYAAEQVAAHERISLDQAYQLSVRQALNDLAYLKAKAQYETDLIKNKK